MALTKTMSGYPSIDKPWMQYYSTKEIDLSSTQKNIYRFLFEENADNLEKTALIYFNRKISYKSLFEKIDMCASALWNLGIRKGDMVTIQSLSMPQIVIMIYALGKIGATANILYVTEGEEAVRDSLVATHSKIYVALDAIYEKTKNAIDGTDVEKVVLFSLGEEADCVMKCLLRMKMGKKKYSEKHVIRWSDFMNDTVNEITENSDSMMTAALIYTSGTTGKSKAVELSHAAMNSLAIQYKYADVGMKKGELFMNALPQFIAFGLVFSLHVPLCLGLTDILIADPTPSKMGKNFVKYKPNYFVHGINAVESIMGEPKVQNMDLSFVRILAAGGENIPVIFERKVNEFLAAHNSEAKLSIGYGMTEVAATVVTSSSNVYKEGTVGIPLPTTNLKIVREDSCEEVGYNTDGEICFQAPTMMKGYFQNSEETARIMKLHDDGMWWIHSGDMGQIDENGFVTIVGRYKRMVPVRRDAVYHKVFPKRVEDVLETVSGVYAIAVVGKPSDEADELHKLVAFVILEKEMDWNEMLAKLKSKADEELSLWECPTEYRQMNELPRTQIGKVDFKALEELAKNSKN